MSITIAICTAARTRPLEGALASLARVRVPAGLAPHLLLVDNNLKDGAAATTEAILRRALPLFPPAWTWAYVRETRSGVSHARNRALDEARGEAVVYADDDVVFDAGWLDAFARGLAAEPRAAYLGGRILPLFERRPPGWVRANLRLLAPVFALYDYGPGALVRRAGDATPAFRYPYGASFAVRLDAVRRHGLRFDPERGHRAGLRRIGEETELMRALDAAGEVGRYCGDALLHHRVPAARLHERYVWSWYAGAGASNLADDLAREPGVARLAGVPRWTFARLARALASYVRARLGGSRPGAWIDGAARPAWLLGYIGEARRVSALAPAPGGSA